MRKLYGYAVPVFCKPAHAGIERDDIGEFVDGRIPLVRPDEKRLLPRCLIQAVAKVALVR